MWEITGLLLIATTLWLIWRKRKFSVLKELGIPGPEPNILFGNLWELTKEGPLKCHKKWTQKYGRVSGYYFGTKPIILVTDPDFLKRIEISEFHKFPNRPICRQSNIIFTADFSKSFKPPWMNLFEMGRNKSSTTEQEGFEKSLISLRDKRWKDIRSIITPSFTTSKMKLMSSVISRAVDVMIQKIDEKAEAKETFDIYEFYQALTMDVIGRTAFGIQTDVQRNPNDPFLRTARIILAISISNVINIISVSFPEFSSFWYFLRRIYNSFRNKGRNPTQELLDAAADVIRVRRNDKSARRNDLLQMMIDAEMSEEDLKNVRDQDLAAEYDEKQMEKEINGTPNKEPSKSVRHMTDGEITENAFLFFLAGYETTSTTLAFITHFLIHYPEVQERIRKEVQDLILQEGSLHYTSVQKLQYMDQVICESLRMYPPVHLFVNREVGEDVKYGDMNIKKGLAVQVPVYILHHDPELWAEPEKFDPKRFAPENKSHNPLAWQPFGAGPRNCVGMRFALMEIKLALAKLLQKYRLVATDETEKDPITLHVASANMTPAKGITLKAELL